MLYNLLYYQVIVKLCATLTESECDQIIMKYSTDETVEFTGFSSLGSSMAFVLKTMNKCRHLRMNTLIKTNDNASFPSTSNSTSHQQINLNLLEQQLQKLCLPFLRVAALLQHHLYEQSLPEINEPQLEFVRLIYFLELVTVDIDWNSFGAAKALCFIPGFERMLPELWCEQLMSLRRGQDFDNEDRSIASLISSQHALWQQPKLLRLPREYEKLFTVNIIVIVITLTIHNKQQLIQQ